jgi:SAM-dependent methyltransferase
MHTAHDEQGPSALSDVRLERYFQFVRDAGLNPGNVRFEASFLFDGIDLRGTSVLDVGAGNGVWSFYAASAGADLVVSLEPEAAGASAGVAAEFERGRAALGLEQVHLVPDTLQAYEAHGQMFDVLLLGSSINHLDEDACARLRSDPVARARYQEHFGKLAALAGSGARLIVKDCGRRNLFASLRLNHPIAPSIEWHKHQEPELWIRLLQDAGFRQPRVRWYSFNSLRGLGRVVLGNRAAAYCLTSGFCLTMERS